MRKLAGAVAVSAIAVLLGHPAALGTVVKTTVNVPASLTSNTVGSNVGYSYGLQGPGALASTNTAVFAVGSGSLSHARTGSRTVDYVETAPSSSLRYRFVTSVVGGYSFSYAGRTSLLWWSSGSATVGNTLNYTVTKTVDGSVQVVLSGSPGTSVTVGSGTNSGTQFTPVFQYYGSLVAFTTNASLSASVTSTNSVTASPISWGAVSGSVYAFVFGS